MIRHAIEQGDVTHLDTIANVIRRTGALDRAREAAELEAQRAIAVVSGLPQNAYQQGLLQLAADLLTRRA